MGYPAAKLFITVEEYLEGEQLSDLRHEYFDGRVKAMAGASVRHNIAAGWVYRQLQAGLAGGPCKIFISDVKIRTQARQKDLFYYPDVMVCCDPRDQHPLYREYPKLIVEILSQDENKDLVEKYFAYPRIETVEEYVIIRPDPEPGNFEVYRHLKSEGWDPGISVAGGILRLESVGVDLDLDELRRELQGV
jgi:Uma2 family endonuclease